jgi:hypothetical protein
MQLTRFDRWLREKFVYQTQIRTLRPPTSLPNGVTMVKTRDIPGQRYKYLYVANTTKAVDQFIFHLKEAGQMYTTQVIDRDRWYTPFIAPKTKSVTWWAVSTVFTILAVCIVLAVASRLAGNAEFRRNFEDALRLFQS